MKISAFHKLFSRPFKTILPGLIGLSILATRSLLKESLSNVINDGDHLTQQEIISASSENYFTFMLMVLLINLALHRSEMKKYFLSRKEQDQKIISQKLLIYLLKSFLIYTALYCFYQVVWMALFYHSLSLPFLHEVTTNPIKPRILEERSLTIRQFNNAGLQKKPSLSIGKVMSEVDVVAYSIKLSKDGRTLFVAANYPPALKIIDISDSEYPIVLSSVPLTKGIHDVIYRSMIISPDETKIYISNFQRLEVIDISNLKAPVYLAQVKDEITFKSEFDYKVGEICEPNMIMSKDKQFLFVSGFGLQVFDISDTKAPVLISSFPSQINSAAKLLPSSIALSQDGKTLYYTNGAFWIYNVEDPKDLKVINSFETTTKTIFTSMILSKDYKTVFVLSLDEESKILLKKLDISDIHSIKKGKIIQLDQVSTSNPVFLDQTPDNVFLLIRFEESGSGIVHNLLVFDPQEERIVTHEKNILKKDITVLFAEDYKKMFIGSIQKLKIVDLYLDFPNKNAFSNSSNIIRTLNTQMKFLKTSFAPSNENILYSVSNEINFGIHKLSAGFDQFTNISFYDPGDKIYKIIITKDNQKAFLMGGTSIFILDISNSENITLMSEYELEKDGYYSIENLILSRDGSTGFLISTHSGSKHLSIIDFSDPKHGVKKSSLDLGIDNANFEAVLSKDERALFLVSRNLDVYSVSDHSSPVFLAQLTFLVDQKFFQRIPEVTLSPDGKTLFLKDASTLNYFAVHVIDVSNVFYPQIKSEFRFPPSKFGLTFEGEFFAVSRDSKTLYILRDFSLMALDVSNVASPRYLGAIKIEKEPDDLITAFKLSNDGRKVYFFTMSKKCHIASLQPVYTTYIKEDLFMLGERYNIDLRVIKMDHNFEYNQLEKEYRFTKFALVEPRLIQNPNFEDVVLKPVPSFMSFDLKSQVLTVEPKRKNDLGTYRLYYSFSLRLPKNLFSRMNDTEDLFASLLGLGYVDNQLFLTENFGEYEDFILPIQYFYVKEEIYQILKHYSFETFNELAIVPSLNLASDKNKLKINTASVSNLKVEINLEAGQAKFLSRYYGTLFPTITNEKSKLVLEGNLKDINLALGEVVIQLLGKCDGQVSISDKLNPIMEVSIKNISKYFEHNLPPRRNDTFPLTIQDQMEKELVYTGKYFQIKLNQQAFSDKYTLVENLNYHMVLVKDHNETVLPTWLSFSDMTLMGTAPESLLGRDFDLMLVVKNEFQEFKEPIRLHVKISSSFVLTLLIKYGPYILTVLGLYIKANMIYNILAKKKYKHLKDFYVRIGEEITPEVIFPISFVAGERQEAKRIWELLEKKKERLSSDEEKLDKIKISQNIKRILNELSYKEQEEFNLYLEGHHHETRRIDQIVFNSLTTEMLKSNEEKETRICFEKIKKQWPEFVDWDLENSCFKINNEKFENILLQQGNDVTISTSLIHKTNINVDLLKDAILAFTFDSHNINSFPAFVEFKVKEKTKRNWLKRFLRWDLEDCPFTEKGKIGYGMTYNKDYNTLFFNGVVKSDLKRKTLVFQVRNRQQKILKEVWIIGNGNLSGNESYIKGKEYQIL